MRFQREDGKFPLSAWEIEVCGVTLFRASQIKNRKGYLS